MGKEPGEIREEIEQTRDRMSLIADALADKADVRSRAKDKAKATKEQVTTKVRAMVPSNRDQARDQAVAAKDRLVGGVRAAIPKDRDQAREQVIGGAKRVAAGAKNNRGRLAVGAATAGALIWRAKITRARSRTQETP